MKDGVSCAAEMVQVTRWSGTTSSAVRTETRARNTALWCISAANDATGTVETLYTETGIKCVCFADTVS
jgi:hypothetical protein